MKLLFKEGTFSDEFKGLIGFVDADIKFRTIKSDLRSATKEMVKLIGQQMYDCVIGIFEKPAPAAEEKELLFHVQYPIALNAFRLSLPTSDLQHTGNGRVMRSDEHEKAPFEWMIERDDRSLERKYYRALDDLLNYLEDENPEIEEGQSWKGSDAYKKQKEFFVNSTEDFDEYFPINSRLLLIRLLPGIRKAERDHIRAIIGKEKYDELKEAQKGDGIPDGDKPLLELIKEACVYYALAWAMKRLTATLFPEGVLQQYVSSKMLYPKKNPQQLQRQLAHQEFSNDAAGVFREIEALIAPAPDTTSETMDEPLDYDFGFDCDDKFATT